MQIPPEILNTRRCFYFIPKEGAPIKLVHKIEAHNLDHLPGEKKTYFSHHEIHRLLGKVLKGVKTVAMEYSPNQAIPTASVIDGGLIDLVRGYGAKVVSFAPFLQAFTCLVSDEQYKLHMEGAQVLEKAVAGAWELIRSRLSKDESINEYQVQQFILDYFKKEGCVTEGEPICGVNGNAADPHYIPTKEKHAPIKKGTLSSLTFGAKKVCLMRSLQILLVLELLPIRLQLNRRKFFP